MKCIKKTPYIVTQKYYQYSFNKDISHCNQALLNFFTTFKKKNKKAFLFYYYSNTVKSMTIYTHINKN